MYFTTIKDKVSSSSDIASRQPHSDSLRQASSSSTDKDPETKRGGVIYLHTQPSRGERTGP